MNLPAIPAASALTTPQQIAELAATLVAWAETVDDIAQVREVSAKLAAITEYVRRTSREGVAEAEAALRKLEVRVGELLGPAPGAGANASANAYRAEARRQFNFSTGNTLELIVRTLAALVADGDLVLPIDISAMVERVIHERDETARRAQVDHVQLVVDCISGATILGTDDPIMSQVALAGSGLRKTWRFVSVDDLNVMAGVKQQHATDAAVAANEFSKRIRLIVRYLLANYGADGRIGDIAP